MAWRSSLATVLSVVVTALATLVLAEPANAVCCNDDFKDAVAIQLGKPIDGTTIGATMEADEPRPPGSFGYSVWFRFYASRRVSVLLNTCRPEWEQYEPVTAVSIYAGQSLDSLQRIDSNTGACFRGARVSFTARPGRTYSIAITADGEGPFRLRPRAIDTPPNDDFRDAIPIHGGSTVSATTRNATLERGEPGYNPRSVWFKLRPARTRRIALRAVLPPDRDCPEVSVFTGRAIGRLSAVASNDCSLRFTAQANTTYRIRVSDYRAGSAFRFSCRQVTEG